MTKTSRGGRFAEFNDRLANAILDMGLMFVIEPSPAFAEAAKKLLPEARLFTSGKLMMPSVKQQAINDLHAVLRQNGDTSKVFKIDGSIKTDDDGKTVVDTTVRCLSPMTSGLPRKWDEIDVGHLVVAQESPAYGWWEAVCIKREGDVLTLRWRDTPKLPLFVRHVTTVALINPGPFAEAAA